MIQDVRMIVDKSNSPAIFYRYFAFGSFIENILSGRSLRFQNPLLFNDPFDGRPSVYADPNDPATAKRYHEIGKRLGLERKERRRKVREIGKRLEKSGGMGAIPPEDLRKNAKLFGVLCLTPHRDNLLMWAHYGDSHKGVCIGFDVGSDFFQSAFCVEYQDDYPLIKFGYADSDDILKKSILTKGKCWEYEHEWRVIKNTCSPQDKVMRRKEGEALGFSPEQIALLEDHDGPGDYPFDKGAVREIILGAELLPTNAQRIEEWVEKHNSGAKILRAKCHSHEYRLVFEP